MTRDEIISMAREAGARVFGEKIVIADNASSGDGSDFVPRFAALVAAHEREELLDLVDSYAKDNADLKDAIRARAEKETT